MKPSITILRRWRTVLHGYCAGHPQDERAAKVLASIDTAINDATRTGEANWPTW